MDLVNNYTQSYIEMQNLSTVLVPHIQERQVDSLT